MSSCKDSKSNRVANLLIPDPEQPWLDLDFHEPMDNVSAASTEAWDRRYRIAIGPHSVSRTLALHDPTLIRTDRSVKALTADRDGFSFNAAVSCKPHQRDRLTVRADGQVQYALKHPFRNGTTHILFSPLDFLSKLAALVPRPRHNLVRYHGVFARGCHQPNAKMRRLIVSKHIVSKHIVSKHIAPKHIVPKHIVPKRNRPIGKVKKRHDPRKAASELANLGELYAPLTWVQRLKRVFNLDIASGLLCGGDMCVIKDITDPEIIEKILDHINAQPRLSEQLLFNPETRLDEQLNITPKAGAPELWQQAVTLHKELGLEDVSREQAGEINRMLPVSIDGPEKLLPLDWGALTDYPTEE